jgi:hypothetical protein
VTPIWYQTLLVVHILAGTAWVGGAFVIQTTTQRTFRLGGRPAVDRARTDLAWADTWLAIPAPLLVVGTGIAMVVVNTGWRFAQTWIWLAMATFGIYQALALTVGARLYRQEEKTQGDQPTRSLLRLGNVLLALLTGIVVLMVFKPGDG